MSKPKFFETWDVSKLDCFGVSSVLNTGSKVYYSNVFTPAQIGRVSDLIVARLREFNPDELRLRAMLLYGVFESFSASRDQKSALNQVSVECGIDDQKVAVGVSFNFTGDPSNSLQGEFQALLQFLTQHSDHVFVRTQISKKRVEVITILGLSSQEGVSFEQCPLQTIEVSEAGAQSPAPAAEYVELGDVDYRGLLKADAVSQTPASQETTAEPITRVRGPDSTELADAIRLRGNGPQVQEARKVSGSYAAEDTKVQVISGAESKETSVQKISSTPSQASDEARTVSGGEKVDSETVVIPASKNARNSVQQTKVPGMSTAESFLRKIWPFRKKEVEADELDLSEDEFQGPTISTPEPIIAPAPAEDDDIVTVSDPNVAKLVGELQEKALTGTLAKAQQEIVEVKKDIPNDKAKLWVDNLMGDFLQEKARLNELAKKLGMSIRQKEHEFKSKERAFQQEVQRRDDLIRQKTVAANRAKDQLAQVNMALERMKSAGTGEDSNLKAKYAQTQKYLTTAKTENSNLMSKVSELKEQLLAAQNKARVAPSDQSALQNRLDRTQKQLDEFKKANQQLLDKLGQTKDRSAENDGIELKKRLESSLKLVHAAKKESERLSSKVEEMQKEELRLKSEMARTQAENRKLKSTITKLEKVVQETPKDAPKGPKAA